MLHLHTPKPRWTEGFPAMAVPAAPEALSTAQIITGLSLQETDTKHLPSAHEPLCGSVGHTLTLNSPRNERKHEELLFAFSLLREGLHRMQLLCSSR